ncbi:MAG: C10 family peptidase [Muribaculaceae bacterium]|nr:C10 family peptidase [Muribaculaceae bacterium]
MNKTLQLSLATVAGLLMSVDAYAAVLTPEEALERVFRENTLRKKIPASLERSTQLVYTVEDSAAVPAVYIFGSADNSAGGFAIVSASDVATGLLGFSDTAIFDPADIPVNMKSWLQGYADEISAAENAGAQAQHYTLKAKEYEPIGPLLYTTWNQNSPYNDRCPVANGRRSVTGCLATAEAQVLNYHRFPEKANGNISYKWTFGGGNLECDFDTIPLDWQNMLGSYEKTEATDVEKNAVANLMLACGLASQMNYSPGESGATSLNGAQGLCNYLGCTQAGIVLAEWLNPDQLEEFVYDYICSRGPLVYCGQSKSGGHAFVCDGYKRDGYFHFNWGWGGMSDGYFRLNALNPGSQGIGGSTSGYNANQQLIVGLHRPVGDNEWEPVMAADGGSAIDSEWNTVLGDTVMITSPVENGGFWNFSMAPATITFGARFVRNATGEEIFQPCYGIIDRELPSMRGWKAYPVVIPENLAEGTYSIYPAYQTPGHTCKDFLIYQDAQTYTLATVRNDSILFEKPRPADIEISDIEFTTPTYAGGGFSLTANVIGIGDRKFYGSVALVLGEFFDNDFVSDFQAANVVISADPGVSESFTYTATFTNQRLKGTYSLVFIVPETGKIISEPVEVTIEPFGGNPTPVTTDAIIINANATDPQDIKVKANVKSENAYFSSNFYLAVGSIDNGIFNMIQRYESPVYYILPGDTAEISFGGAMAASEGEIYTARLQYYDASTRKFIQIGEDMTFTIGKPNTSAIETVGLTDTSSEYYTIDGKAIGNTRPQRGIYIRRQGSTTSKITL